MNNSFANQPTLPRLRAEYDGTQLAEKDVLVVTINYRLGALGFLVSIEDGLFGNYGLMDQR